MRRAALVLVLAAGVASAQTVPTLPKLPLSRTPETKLELHESPAWPAGKVALVEGVAGARPHHLFVENLEIMQPVAVTVLTKDPAHDVKLQLGKYDWDKNTSRDGSTKGTTALTFKLRTAGDLRIMVSSPDREPRPFQLVVWAGDVATPVLPPIAVNKSAWQAPAGEPTAAPPIETSRATTTRIIVGSLLGLVLLLLLGGTVLFLRRRRAR